VTGTPCPHRHDTLFTYRDRDGDSDRDENETRTETETKKLIGVFYVFSEGGARPNNSEALEGRKMMK
jgi:hypothetical protein